jgi:hypothetical protein
LVYRKSAFVRKVEGLYIGKELQTVQHEGKQSVNNAGLFNALRKQMRQTINSDDVWEEKDGLVVSMLGRRMVAEEWSTREEAVVQKGRVTGRESMTFHGFQKHVLLWNLVT